MIRNLSQKQLDVMKILWDAGTPLVASDIVKAESSMNINTVQASLRVLLKENLVEIADIVYSGTVLSRSYRPLISRDVYFNAEYKNIIGNSSTSAMIATFIEQEEDISELERIEELIRKRKSSKKHNKNGVKRFHTVRIFTESVEYTTGSALYAKKVPILCSFKFSPITITTFCPSVIGSSRIS